MLLMIFDLVFDQVWAVSARPHSEIDEIGFWDATMIAVVSI